MTAPNRDNASIGFDGPHDANADARAEASGLFKLTNKSDGSMIYRTSPDAKEIVAHGEYEITAWPSQTAGRN